MISSLNPAVLSPALAARKQRISFFAGTVIVVVTLVSVASVLFFLKFREDSRWVSHTYEVISTIRKVLAQTTDAETAERGYVITGDESYLEPYEKAKRTIHTDLDHLSGLIDDNPEQLQRLRTLVPLIEKRLWITENGNNLRRNEGFAIASKFISTGVGKATEDEIRIHIAEMEAAENTLLEARTATSRSATVNAIALNSLGGLLSILLAFLTAKSVTKMIRAENLARDAEASLREAGERLQLWEANVKDYAIVNLSVDGNVMSWSRGAELIKGYSSAEIIGKHFSLFYPSEAIVNDLPVKELKVAHDAGHVETEGWRARKDGSRFWANVVITALLDEQGTLRGYIKMTRDMTERRISDELIRRTEVAEATSQAKSSFLANMSHEIRTPMNAIIGLTQITLDSSLNPKQRDQLQKVFRSSKALLGILDDILDYSKIEAGKLDLERVEFSLEEVVKNVSELYSAKIAEQGLELFLDIDRNIRHHLIGDPLRLGQILNNLVGNAIKFTELGEIHIRVELIRREESKIKLRFAVRDTGIGMDKTQSDRLFTAFNQADSSITRKYGGTGLGLTIVKKLVEMMGGEIALSSALGQGSTFSFTACFGEGDKLEMASYKIDLHPMRALVVDDQETSLVVLEHYLQGWQFDVTGTTSGEEAMELISLADRDNRPFEILLVDWRMPGMDGLELTRRIEAESKSGALKRAPTIIMVTAYDRESLLKAAGATPLDSVLVKPVTPSTLFDSLMRVQQPGLADQIRSREDSVDLYEFAAPIRGAKILLVEDNDINQEVAMEFLTKAGLVITLANHGGEALEWVQKEQFDAVLMDVQMPVMDGLEATRVIRELPQGKELPIFALSAAAMTQDIQASLKAGMNGHISKPFDPEQLISTLLKFVKKQTGNKVSKSDEVAGTMEQLPKAIPGFDLPIALARVHGNQAMLVKLLLRFAKDYASTADQVNALLHDNKKVEAARLLHGFRGACSILGAKDLADSTQKFEKEIQSGSVSNTQDHFTERLRETVNAIQQQLSKPPSGI